MFTLAGYMIVNVVASITVGLLNLETRASLKVAKQEFAANFNLL